MCCGPRQLRELLQAAACCSRQGGLASATRLVPMWMGLRGGEAVRQRTWSELVTMQRCRMRVRFEKELRWSQTPA
jgi:hypothetical protein